jgi:hypothetical protein
LKVPACITVTDSGLFLDGGSIRLTAIDNDGVSHQLFLDLSFISRDRHYVQFYRNGVVVLKHSDEETHWLNLLEHAEIRDEQGHHAAGILAEPWKLSAVETAHAFQSKTLSTIQITRYLVSVFCETIRSADYNIPPTLGMVEFEPVKPAGDLSPEGNIS